MQKWTVVDIIINSRLYSITASTWNQHQQMPTAYFVRRPSASATLVQCHSRGGESYLTHLQSQRRCLIAGAVVQLVSVTGTSVWPALLLMRAAVSADALSLNQMTKLTCKCPLSLKPPSPCPLLSAFGLTSPLPPRCGRPLWMTPSVM